jgi:F-type H+-transporting ATPase subunit delta
MSETIKSEAVFDDESMHVGQVYAKALLGAAKSSGDVSRIVEQFQSLISDVLDKQPVLESILSNPKVPSEDKLQMLDKVFKKQMDGTLLTFLKVLATRRRFGAIRSIYLAAVRLNDEAVGRLRISVTTAEALDASALASLKIKLTEIFKTEVVVSTKVDTSVLGGLLIRVGDVVFDGSVDGQLKQLKKATLARAEQAVRDRLSSLAS